MYHLKRIEENLEKILFYILEWFEKSYIIKPTNSGNLKLED